ncbi:MAG: efflux RND transporter periplasmic adaptor subunit [Planctomycetales bacterium]
MKRFLRWLVILTVVGGSGVGLLLGAADYWQKRNQPTFRLVEVTEGRIISVVNATGKVQPVRTITVGSFVSGTIDTAVPLVEYNREVAQGDLLCKIDPRTYKANLDRDQATLDSRNAELSRAQAHFLHAQRDLERMTRLSEKNKTFIAETEFDKYHFAMLTTQAELALAEASVKVAESSLKFSQTQLDYCEIRAPEAGIVINRKIEPGQTIASQFQTPELFVIAPNMRARVDILAAVDEADIGLIRRARDRTLPVTFTVDAYADELFEGRVEEVRMNSTTTQNVVTYPVIVAAENPQLKLLPGMTASLSFEIDERERVVKVPNAALRFFPLPKQVRPEDRHLVEGTGHSAASEEDRSEQSERLLSAAERSEMRRKRNRRHVWVAEGLLLRAIEVETGLSDSHHTELVQGEVHPGDMLATGIIPPAPFSFSK